MASVTDRLIGNREQESSHLPSSDRAPVLPPLSHISTYQSMDATPDASLIPSVESVPETSSSSRMTHQTSEDPLLIEDSANSSDSSDNEQTAAAFVTPNATQATTTRPPLPASRDTYTSSRSSLALAGLNYARREFNPSDHRTFEKTFTSSTWSTASSPDNPPPDTARPYLFGRQSWRLWRLAVGEFLITAILCLLYITSLIHYCRKTIMYPDNQAWFNAISQSITFLLGVSIAASLRSYAKLMRWRILALRFRPLETFDLVLACDSLVNVFKLLYKGGRRGHERMGFWKYLPSRTQAYCICWIILKATVLFLVGYAGSLANLDAGGSYVGRYMGNTSITNFAALGGIDSDAKLARMQTWASRGFRYTGTQGLDYSSAKLSTFSTLRNGTAAYWPKVFDPSDYTNRAVSYRQIRADTVCTTYTVTSGQFGNESTITYIDDNGSRTTYSFPDSAQPGPGGFLASSHINSTCGSRCVNIDTFLAQTKPGTPIKKLGRKMTISYDQAKFFRCNNTVSPVLMDNHKVDLSLAPEPFALSDSWAQMVAGAVGWESEGAANDDDSAEGDQRPAAMFIAYPATSELGTYLAINYPSTPNATNMADTISSVSMVGLAAADDSNIGLQYFEYVHWYMPIRSQRLSVDALTAAGVIGAIVFGQFVALIFIFIFANGAIIKSDSPISIAKFYHSLLYQHGFSEVGCLLKGEEIIDKMGNPEVTYGWTVGKGERGGREIRHIDIYEKDADDEEKQVSSNFKDKAVYYYD